MHRELDWGRPYGRPFSPELLTLEEWLILYRMLPTPEYGQRDYIRIAIPEKMEVVVYDKDDVPDVKHMNIVAFRGQSYYACSHEGSKGYVWYPEGASHSVLGLLRTAGMMNPLGSKY